MHIDVNPFPQFKSKVFCMLTNSSGKTQKHDIYNDMDQHKLISTFLVGLFFMVSPSMGFAPYTSPIT